MHDLTSRVLGLRTGFILTALLAGCGTPEAEVRSSTEFHGLDAFGPVPANLSDRFITCPVADSAPEGTFNGKSYRYRTSDEIDFGRPGWETRAAADWHALDGLLGDISAPGNGTPVNTDNGVSALVIDMKRVNGRPAYLYLANNGRQNAPYEPWSASKFMAASAAMARMRTLSGFTTGGDAKAGAYAVGDMITAIHTYNPIGNVPGASNEIATYFLDLAGRKFTSDLMHDRWLRMSDASQFCGGFGTARWDRPGTTWSGAGGAVSGSFSTACNGYNGSTGKYMSLLTMGEWLKRTVHHELVAERLPGLQAADVRTLLYGNLERNGVVGGMLAGESVYMAQALMGGTRVGRFGSHGGPENEAAQKHFNARTGGKWRIFHKLGAGPSSRSGGRAEIVMAAYACLPEFEGGREFVVVTRASTPGSWAQAATSNRQTELAFNRIVQKLVPGFSAAPPPPAPRLCRIGSTDGSANVRSAPSSAQDNVIAVLPEGTEVRVVRRQGNWSQVEFRWQGVDFGEGPGRPAWIYSKLLSCG